ncbi:MAG: ATP-binding protein [Tyzzerella sp.]|nr:ATP-binding protein [Tyzzerella sp.]
MKKGKKPENWLEAFYMLEKYLDEIDDGSRQLIFLDELPWLDTPRSGFVTAFEGFWNTWGCHRDNLMVVVCGSANSWILDKLINNHGGLYNRVTYEIKLAPFTLNECEKFYTSKNVKLSRYDIAQSYMILGGIPYYMGYFQSGMSLAQNIDNILFSKQGKLRDEYNRLFASIFSNPELMKKIVALLYTRNAGYTRTEIAEKVSMNDGGTLSQSLNALIASDFVIKYIPFGKGKREHYKLVDPFCMFYLHFVDKKKKMDDKFWQQNVSTQQIVSWRGFAYENVCFNHVSQIKKALGISGVITTHSAWSKRSDDTEGAQIDLLISRNDNVVNMCEIKYYGGEFVVGKEYYQVLLKRQEILAKEISPKISIHNTLITTFGLAYNEYSGVFSNVLTLDDLFAE